EERRALGLEGLPHASARLERPLASYWEGYARGVLAREVAALERGRTPLRAPVLSAVAEQLERLHERGPAAFALWDDRVDFLSRAPADLLTAAAALEDEQPERAAALVKTASRWAHEAVEVALEFARWVLVRPAAE